MPMQCFIHVKVNFEKKNSDSSHWGNFRLVLAKHTIMLQHLITHVSLHYLSSGRLREVKNKGKFQNVSSKSGRSRLREIVSYKRFQI